MLSFRQGKRPLNMIFSIDKIIPPQYLWSLTVGFVYIVVHDLNNIMFLILIFL